MSGFRNCSCAERRSFVQSFNKLRTGSISDNCWQILQYYVGFFRLLFRPFKQNVGCRYKKGSVKKFVTAILRPYHQVWWELRTCLKTCSCDLEQRSKSKTIAAHRRFPTDTRMARNRGHSAADAADATRAAFHLTASAHPTKIKHQKMSEITFYKSAR